MPPSPIFASTRHRPRTCPITQDSFASHARTRFRFASNRWIIRTQRNADGGDRGAFTRLRQKRKRASLRMPASQHRPIYLAAKLCPGADCGRLGRSSLVFAVRLLLLRLSALADVDAALEERAVFNRDACRNHVARKRTVAANVH